MPPLLTSSKPSITLCSVTFVNWSPKCKKIIHKLETEKAYGVCWLQHSSHRWQNYNQTTVYKPRFTDVKDTCTKYCTTNTLVSTYIRLYFRYIVIYHSWDTRIHNAYWNLVHCIQLNKELLFQLIVFLRTLYSPRHMAKKQIIHLVNKL